MTAPEAFASEADRAQRPPLAIILLLACALRLFRLGADSIWYDEGVSVYLANLNLPALVAHTAGDIHPPLYYAALHLWLMLAGHSQFAAAFFSVCFGMLLAAMTYALARRLFGQAVALLAALLVALSPYHLWYSQEVRMYTMGAFLGVLTFWYLLKALAFTRDVGGGEGGRGGEARAAARTAWLGYVVCAVLGLYTLYYFAFILLFEAAAVMVLWLVARRGGRGAGGSAVNLRAWALAQAAVLLLYLPWLPVAWRQATQPPVPPWRGFTSLPAVLVESWSALTLGQSAVASDVALVLLLALIVYGAAVLERSGRRSVLLLVGYTFAPLLVIWLASLWTPLYHVRYVFLFAPAFAIVLARGIVVLRRHAPTIAALALTVLILAGLRSAQAYFFDPQYAPDDQRAAARFLSEQVRPGDALLINAGYAYPPFVYYYSGEIAWRGRLTDFAAQAPVQQPGLVVLQTGSIGGSATLGWGDAASDFYATTEAATAAALDDVARRHERLWVLRIYDTVTDPTGFVRRYLDERFLPLDDAGFGGTSSLRVQLYRTYREPHTSAPSLDHELNVNIGDRLRLVGYNEPGALSAAEATDLTIYWQALAGGPDLRAFVGLVDANGREWAHWDSAPGGRLYPTSRFAANEVIRQSWRLDTPAGTPPGRYRLEVGLYEAGSGRRLDVLDNAGRSLGATARLGDVLVGPARRVVDVANLPFAQRVNADLGDAVRLVGYGLSSRLAAPGQTVELGVMWQGISPPAEELVVFVQLLDRSGKLWAAAEGPPVAPWRAGELLRDDYRLLVPADAPDGELRLIIGVYRAANGQRLAVRSGLWPAQRDSIDLGLVRVAGRERSFAIPTMQARSAARVGDVATLLGYDLSPDDRPLTLAPSQPLRVTLHWQGVAPTGVSYTVFVQLLGAGIRQAGQSDAIPGEGLLPTTSWVKDEVLSDTHELTIRPDAAAGEYRLVVGMYDAASGARLPVSIGGVRQPDDMIVLGMVTVR
jgi:uncharacterized membrane protein